MLGGRSKKLLDATVGSTTVGLLRVLKYMDRARTANAAAACLRRVGPLTKEHRLGRDNLRAAFPEKSDAEIETILSGVWDNLARVAAEFAHLDDFHLTGPSMPGPGNVAFDEASRERYQAIIDSGRPTIDFTAHLANWEIAALAAKQVGVKSAVLYRRPNIRAISEAVIKLRADVMGELIPTGLDAPVRLARLLEAGHHVGMLVDQHYTKGVDVTFFGRRCKANPLLALLARQTEYPIHGMRIIRLPENDRFRVDITEEVKPVRAADGRVDIAGTTQAITSVVEGWVREYPQQWLWLHRRWR
jgi:KDO2-lipid IV(A) lauroyltransferase